jgi:tRNA threonylcarbamoyladenosine biosynthesis protein TsaB
MLLLALDTSTRHASIALCSDDEVLSEYTWFSDKNHSVDLLGHIQQMFAEHRMTLQQLDAVAVATGPGSFNGVRVALATAKALSFALKKPLLGIGTLDIIATQQQHFQGPVCAMLDAGRSELYAACYIFDESRKGDGDRIYCPKQLGTYLLLAPQDLVTYLQEQLPTWLGSSMQERVPPMLFCGEMSAATRQVLHTVLPADSLLLDNMRSTRHAVTLALLAFQRLSQGQVDDPLLLEPLYLRRPSITTSTRKQPLLGGTSQRPAGQYTTEREEGALRH